MPTETPATTVETTARDHSNTLFASLELSKAKGLVTANSPGEEKFSTYVGPIPTVTLVANSGFVVCSRADISPKPALAGAFGLADARRGGYDGRAAEFAGASGSLGSVLRRPKRPWPNSVGKAGIPQRS
jgi:hypothetical protein